ncbi:MAG: UbiX family flavin prenyltransferase [Gammaproteobacteria bacterium]|nr:UbiX family flavin prenyltransferase [Gammaproteobacteria bacterium]
MNNYQRITVALTGASGAAYGLRLLECLVQSKKQIYVLISSPARVVLATETDIHLPSQAKEVANVLTQRFNASENQIQVFNKDQWMSPVASGSNAADAMVVCPCSTGTLSAISCGASRSLIERAADVMLKEGRKLILVPRETPYSAIHLENMLKLSKLGVTILPASPGFYHKPESVADVVDFVVARILDQLHIDQTLAPRWGASDDD